MNLFVFGCGYSASYFLRFHAKEFDTIIASTRGLVEPKNIPRVTNVIFDGNTGSNELENYIENSQFLIISVPPNASGDPVFNQFSKIIAGSRNIQTIIYLSTIGVYGDHRGAWVNETTQPDPQSTRSIERLKAEKNWQSLGENNGKIVHVLRLAGIYGPGQNALENLRNGTARRLVKPGQVFNRIHVEDISRAISAVIECQESNIWNISDNEPAPPQDVVGFAAKLLGINPPIAEDFADAAMTPMARSFYGENKRVSNERLCKALNVQLAYPTYREGISALHDAMSA